MKKRFINGYVLVYVPNHFNTMSSENWNGWQYEHRYVMEINLQRPLLKIEHVHHINGDKKDNNLSNLKLLTNSQHSLLHAKEDGKDIKKELKCMFCNNSFIGYSSRNKYCSVECSTSKHRRVERPSKEDLEILIKSKSFVEIGLIFGVSDNAVRKWCRKYNLPHLKKDLKKFTSA